MRGDGVSGRAVLVVILVEVPVVVCLEVISQLALLTPYRALFLSLPDLLPSHPPHSANGPSRAPVHPSHVPDPIPHVFFPPSLNAAVVVEDQDHARRGRGEVGDWMHSDCHILPDAQEAARDVQPSAWTDCLKLTKFSYFRFTFV